MKLNNVMLEFVLMLQLSIRLMLIAELGYQIVQLNLMNLDVSMNLVIVL